MGMGGVFGHAINIRSSNGVCGPNLNENGYGSEAKPCHRVIKATPWGASLNVNGFLARIRSHTVIKHYPWDQFKWEWVSM